MGFLRRHRDATDVLSRALLRLQQGRRGLSLDLLPAEPPHPRREPDLLLHWWWHEGERTVLIGHTVVTVLSPRTVETGPLRFVDAAQVVVIGRYGARPGGVERTTSATLQLTPHPTQQTQPPPPTTPDALEELLGRDAVLRIDGGELVVHGGLRRSGGTEDLPAPRGRLVEAISASGSVVLVLADGTVGIVHEPCTFEPLGDGTVRITGDLGRVVLDLPTAVVHVVRDAALLVQPVGDAPHPDPTTRRPPEPGAPA